METVSLIKVASYQDDLKAKILEALLPFGGLGLICKPGDRVLIKPNFIMARSVASAATTHPAIITALVSLLVDHGCEVAVGDSPGLGNSIGVVRKLGLCEIFQKYQVKVVELETAAAIDPNQELPFARRFKNLQLARELSEFDKIINLPKLKSHGQMGITLAIKNLFGCVAGPAKGQWHFAAGRDFRAFARLLIEIAFTVKADIHLLDGIVGMDGNGPSNGRPRQLNILAASDNPVALERVVVELIGKKPEQFPVLEVARELLLPGSDFGEIKIWGEPLESFVIDDFQIPPLLRLDLVFNKPLSRVVEYLIKQRLVLNKKICIKCRECEIHCPAKAISFRENFRINDNKCLKCCCCQELCPVGALKISDPWLLKLARFLKII